MKIVVINDVGGRALVLRMAHQAGRFFRIGLVWAYPVMRQIRRTVKAVATGALGGHVVRREQGFDPVRATAVVINVALLTARIRGEIRMDSGQGPGNRPVEAGNAVVVCSHGHTDEG